MDGEEVDEEIGLEVEVGKGEEEEVKEEKV